MARRRYKPKPLKPGASLLAIIWAKFWEELLKKYPLTQRRVCFCGRVDYCSIEFPERGKDTVVGGYFKFLPDGILVGGGSSWNTFPYCDPDYEKEALARIDHLVQHWTRIMSDPSWGKEN